MQLLSILWAWGTRMFVVKVLAWMAVTFLVKAVVSAGFTYLAFGWISEWIDGYIATMKASAPAGAQVWLDLMAIGGFGVAINLLGSALLGGAAIYLAVNAVRLVLSASGIAGAAAKQQQFLGW